MPHYILWAALITAGYELLSWLVLHVPAAAGANTIPIRAKHLDKLETVDLACAFWQSTHTHIPTRSLTHLIAPQWYANTLDLFRTTK